MVDIYIKGWYRAKGSADELHLDISNFD